MEQALVVTDINTEDVDMLWPLVKDQLASALEHGQGEYELEDIHLQLISGLMRLWVTYDKDGKIRGSAVCEIRVFPRKKVCYVVLMAGQGMDDWLHHTEAVEDWALANGASVIMAYTRKGMAKKLKVQGYREVYSVIQRELVNRRLH